MHDEIGGRVLALLRHVDLQLQTPSPVAGMAASTSWPPPRKEVFQPAGTPVTLSFIGSGGSA
jgi:hypothetical protein